jgi:hypothetical protein
LGIGDWGLGPIPNPQSPIPNPQSPIPIIDMKNNNLETIDFLYLYFNNFKEKKWRIIQIL